MGGADFHKSGNPHLTSENAQFWTPPARRAVGRRGRARASSRGEERSRRSAPFAAVGACRPPGTPSRGILDLLDLLDLLDHFYHFYHFYQFSVLAPGDQSPLMNLFSVFGWFGRTTITGGAAGSGSRVSPSATSGPIVLLGPIFPSPTYFAAPTLPPLSHCLAQFAAGGAITGGEPILPPRAFSPLTDCSEPGLWVHLSPSQLKVSFKVTPNSCGGFSGSTTRSWPRASRARRRPRTR